VTPRRRAEVELPVPIACLGEDTDSCPLLIEGRCGLLYLIEVMPLAHLLAVGEFEALEIGIGQDTGGDDLYLRPRANIDLFSTRAEAT